MTLSKSASNNNACRAVYLIISNLIRLVTLGYAALAVLAFFEVRELIKNSEDENSFEVDDGTLYIPFVMCLPAELPFLLGEDGTNTASTTTSLFNNETLTPSVLSNNYYGEAQCRQLTYMLSAVGASLLFAAAGSVFYVFIDCLAKTGCFGSLTAAGSAGIGLLLSFVLAQAGISTGALAELNHDLVDYFETLIYELDLDLKVESYSSSFILILAAVSGFGVSILILLDIMLYRCCCMTDESARKRRHDEEEEDRQARMKADFGMQRQSEKIEEAAQSSAMTDDIEVEPPTISDGESQRPPWATSVFH